MISVETLDDLKKRMREIAKAVYKASNFGGLEKVIVILRPVDKKWGKPCVIDAMLFLALVMFATEIDNRDNMKRALTMIGLGNHFDHLLEV